MRNFILAAALFLTAGVVFADPFEIQNIMDGTKIVGYEWDVTNYRGWKANQPTYPHDAVRPPHSWENDVPTDGGLVSYEYLKANTKLEGGYYKLSSTVVRTDKDSFSYTVFDKNNVEHEWELSVTYDTEGNITESKNLIGYRDVFEYENVKVDGKTVSKPTDKLLRRVYYFSVPISDVGPYSKTGVPPVKVIGVKTEDVSSITNIANADGDLFYRITDENIFLAFGTATTNEEGAVVRNGDPEIAFGQPLPAPLATLLIALGFGAAFVMYRNRKQAKV